jgi:hypothetical protein
MITLRRQLLGLGFVAASSLLAIHAASALTGPSAIQIDGGPAGALQLSGGVDGYGYYVSNEPDSVRKVDGVNVGAALVQLQKTDGVLQFNIEVGSTGGDPGLGAGKPGQTSITTYTTGPLYYGYVTVAPTGSPVTVSVGQIGSLEGYESGVDWNNAVQLTTAIFEVQNANSRGVSATLTEGPASLTVSYGDGFDSGVFNVVQFLASYTIDSNDVANVYGTANLGTTGPLTYAYGGGTTGTSNVYVNSNMIGAYYSYTNGSLNLVPEVQFQYAKPNAKAGIVKETTDLGAALFGNYAFGTSPYSIGAWGEYFTEHTSAAGNYSQFIGPDVAMVGFAVAPTWQYKDIFARANAGYAYLLHNKDATGTTYGYGNNGTGRGEFIGTLEAGLLF